MTAHAAQRATIGLGVNIDHVATVRQARRSRYPDPLHAALVAEQSGADSITLHLREDRRHIQDQDVQALRAALQTRMNLEMAVTAEMIGIAVRVLPQDCCLVPESRREITTEGGLDVAAQASRIADACLALGAAGIRVSLFVDPDHRADRGGEADRRAGRRIAHGRLCRRRRRGARARVRAAARLGAASRRPWGSSSTRATGCIITTCSRWRRSRRSWS